MTNVTTLMALAVISLVASIGFASAEVIGDGSDSVHVYMWNETDYGFNVTVVEGGEVIVHNESQRIVGIEHTGTTGTTKGGTFSGTVDILKTVTFDFPITNCSSCYPAGIYHFVDSVSGETGSITIVHPDGWIPPVQEEVGITENVVVVLGTNSTSIAPEPTPIAPEPTPIEPVETDGYYNYYVPYEPTGKHDVATWTGTYDMVLLQEQLAEVSANFNQAVENLGHEKNKVKQLQSQINDINVGYIKTLADKKDLEDELTTMLMEKNEVISDLQNKINNTPDYTEQIAYMTSSVDTLENKVNKLEQEKAEITIEKEKWKTLSDNWYAVAVEQLRVMVNVLGL